MAKKLQTEDGLNVKTVKGGLGEFRILAGYEEIYNANRFWYPTTRRVLEKVREALARSN